MGHAIPALAAIAALSLSQAFAAPAVAAATPLPELRYNGAALAAPSTPPRPQPSGGTPEAPSRSTSAPAVVGYSLGELFPPQLEAWRLTVTRSMPGGALASDALDDDGLGEALYETLLVSSGEGWDLLLAPDGKGRRRRYGSVKAVALEGEACPERNLEAWASWEGVPELKAEIRRWAERSGVTVKTVDVPSIKSKLVTVLRGGGKVPDLVMVQSDYLPDLAWAGALQGLDGLALPAAEPKGKEAFRLGGSLLAAPFYCDTQLVFYAADLVRKAPPDDWTLADMERLARASGAKVPAAWNAYSAYWFLPFALGFGADALVKADGSMDVRHPAYRGALGYLRGAIDRGFLSAMERDAMMAYFSSGKAAFILSGSYSVPEFTRLGLAFGVAPYPLVEAGGRRVAPLLDYKGWAITRTARSPALARRLAQHLSSAGVQASFCGALGKLPANGEAWDLAPVAGTGDYRRALRASYEAGVAVPPAPVYGDFKNASWKLIRLFLAGSMSADETISALATILEARAER